jgi:hypothetical protein
MTRINPRKFTDTFTAVTSECVKLNVFQSEDNQGEGSPEEEDSVSHNDGIVAAPNWLMLMTW